MVLFAAVTVEAAEPMFRGQPVSYWAESYCSNTNPAARQVLEQMGPALAVPALTKLIDQPDVEANEAYRTAYPAIKLSAGGVQAPLWKSTLAASALTSFGPDAEPAVPELIRIFPNRSDQHKSEIARVFSHVGPAASSSVAVLGQALSTTNGELKKEILWAFGHIGPAANSVQPLISNELNNADMFVRLNAAFAIWTVAHETNAALQVFLVALNDSNPYVLGTAINYLTRIGPVAGPAVPQLLKAIQHDHVPVQWEAVRALGWIGDNSPEVISALAAVLKSEPKDYNEVVLQELSASALGRLGPGAREAVPALIATVKRGRVSASAQESPYDLMSEALRALGKIGPNAQAALPLAQSLLKDVQVRVRLAAAEAVWGIDGGRTVQAQEVLIDWKPNLKSLINQAERFSQQRHSLMVKIRDQELLMGALAKADPDLYSKALKATNQLVSRK